MKLKQFITEEYLNSSRGIKLSSARLYELIKSGDYDVALKNKIQIYRGVNSTNDQIIINPKNHVRVSANTLNIYTKLIDSFESWEDYPKRSESLICSLNIDVATSYGNLYVVLPKNDAKIGICPTDDIWSSFNNIGDMVIFNETIYTFILKPIEKAFRFKFKTDFDDHGLIDILKSIKFIRHYDNDRFKMRVKNKILNLNYYDLSYLRKFINNDNYDNLYDYLEYIFKPELNDFTLVKLKDFNSLISDDRECWTDSESIMINADLFNKIKDKLINHEA